MSKIGLLHKKGYGEITHVEGPAEWGAFFPFTLFSETSRSHNADQMGDSKALSRTN